MLDEGQIPKLIAMTSFAPIPMSTTTTATTSGSMHVGRLYMSDYMYTIRWQECY